MSDAGERSSDARNPPGLTCKAGTSIHFSHKQVSTPRLSSSYYHVLTSCSLHKAPITPTIPITPIAITGAAVLIAAAFFEVEVLLALVAVAVGVPKILASTLSYAENCASKTLCNFVGTFFVYQLSVYTSPYGMPLASKLAADAVGAAERMAEFREVSWGESYHVVATDQMADARDVDSAPGMVSVCPT